jgi:hypothetical protein
MTITPRKFSVQMTSTRTVSLFSLIHDLILLLVVTGSYSKILQFAFNSPIVVHDYMQFAVLTQKFKTNTFVIYCDKKDE